jgi:hypothetical protein
MSSDFFKTRMGQRYYEATMPKIADQLERLNSNVKALVAELRKLNANARNKALALQPESKDTNAWRSGVRRAALRSARRCAASSRRCRSSSSPVAVQPA